MSFARNANVAPFTGQQQQNDSWKAQGFVNIYMTTNQGNRRKLGTIFLHENKQLEKQLLDRLRVDPEAVLEQMAAKLEFDFNEAGASENEAFDL